jgi:hypothetical protein
MPAKKSPLQVRIAPSVPVTFDVPDGEAKTKKLELSVSFDVNTMIRIEGKTNLNMLNMLALWTRLNMTVLRAALWAAILPSHPEYDSDEGFGAVAYMLADEVNRERAVEALWNAYMAFLPKDRREDMIRRRSEAEAAAAAGEPPPDEDAEGKKTAEEASLPTGSSSGPAPALISASARANSAS